MKNSQKFILATKLFYWARRHDPLGWRAMNKRRRTVISTAEVARYVVTGKAYLGFCPICKRTTMFMIKNAWLRDNYLCVKYDSIPRVRQIIHVLQRQFPRVREWGMNLTEFIFKHNGHVTTVFVTRDRHMGLAGEFLEIFVSRKPI